MAFPGCVPAAYRPRVNDGIYPPSNKEPRTGQVVKQDKNGDFAVVTPSVTQILRPYGVVIWIVALLGACVVPDPVGSTPFRYR